MLLLLGLSRQNRSPLELVRPDQFCQKTCQNRSPWTTFAAKIGPGGPILAAKNGLLLPKSVPNGGPILANITSAKLGPHAQSGTLYFLRVHGYMDATIL